MDPYNPYLNHHWPPPLMVLDAEVPLPLELPKAYSAYAGFRRRLWSTWKLKSHFPYAYESLWLWEEEDEQYLQEFIDQHWKSTRYVPDWAEKTCSAFETHRSQSTTFTNPLAHLTSQTRLRFIVWLHLRANTATLVHFIKRWARFLSLGGKPGSCKYCGALEFLDIWVETLRAVYSTEHMLSIAWDYDCSCLTKCLNIIHPMLPPTPLTTDSPVLPALYRIIIPPWPLILWMAFRASNDVLLPKFLEIIRDPIHQDVVGWDSDDLFLSGVYDGEEYPHNWIPYLVEIELTDWLQIRDIAGKDHHFDDWNPDHSAICIVAALIIFSPSNTLNASDALPLRLRTAMPKGYPLHSIARVINKDYESTTDPANFASKPKEFWTGPNLESWVATRRLELCHVAWVQSSRSVLERLEFIHEGLTSKRLPQILVIYIFGLVSENLRGSVKPRRPYTYLPPGESNPFAVQIKRNILDSFAYYSADLEVMFMNLNKLVENHSSTSHAISSDVYKSAKQDICNTTTELVFHLQWSAIFRQQFLASRGDQAQRLLNLTQDLLDLDCPLPIRPLMYNTLLKLSRASGLHPHCFALTGLQKIGRQVAAGGFGDIWKGLVRGQSVSVKIVRLFEDSDIQAALKEFGREALVWRQLCHPNVLPFFGLYYLDSRLCLVSPWMERGNIMQYLKKEKSNIDRRVSLILDVALGLEYLHCYHIIIHGDLKAINVLVTPSHRACICDFGLSSIADVTLRFAQSTTSTTLQGTQRYYAPELLKPIGPGLSKKNFASDVYAFACVCYEILTENVPFHEERNDMAVMFRVLDGARPSRPALCMGSPRLDNLWQLIESCWQQKPEDRPTAVQIVQRLQGPLIQATTTLSTSDWDETFTSRFRRASQPRPLLPSVTQIECMLFGDEVAKACKECFPDDEPTERTVERGQTKRHYEEEEPDAEFEDNSPPDFKRSRWD